MYINIPKGKTVVSDNTWKWETLVEPVKVNLPISHIKVEHDGRSYEVGTDKLTDKDFNKLVQFINNLLES